MFIYQHIYFNLIILYIMLQFKYFDLIFIHFHIKIKINKKVFNILKKMLNYLNILLLIHLQQMNYLLILKHMLDYIQHQFYHLILIIYIRIYLKLLIQVQENIIIINNFMNRCLINMFTNKLKDYIQVKNYYFQHYLLN